MKKLIGLTAGALAGLIAVACSVDGAGTGGEKPIVGNVSMPLVQQAGGFTFRVAGTLTIDPTAAGSNVQVNLANFHDELALIENLTPGEYTVTLSAWTMFYAPSALATDCSTPAQSCVDITNLTQLVSPASVVVNVASGSTSTVEYLFNANDFIVNFAVCAGPALNIACPTHDNDGDGDLNGLECPTGLAAPDTDGDGLADCLDVNSDNDCYNDALVEENGAARIDVDLPVVDGLCPGVFPDAGTPTSPDGSIGIDIDVCIAADAAACIDGGV